MRTLDISPLDASLDAAIDSAARVDYVYMYPPRQAYRPVDVSDGRALAEKSLRRSGPINLYVHVPFCKQICSYCNLYAVAGSNDREHEKYVDLLIREFEHYAPSIQHRAVDTLYIGGGTPSMLRPELLGRLTQSMSEIGGFQLREVPEVALEVAPDTVTEATVSGYRAAGINRINLGVQTLDDHELAGIGRKYEPLVNREGLSIAMEGGFENVCVDLIYGLSHQDTRSWVSSLSSVIAHRPETICCYPLTLRPSTGYARIGYTSVDDSDQYQLYDIACALLKDAGYAQETHVRWILPGRGGYRQKSNHWAGQDILGIGAGARSYLWDIDLRNGYSVTHRRSTLAEYERSINERGHGITDGFPMDDDERARKAITLGIGGLDRSAFAAAFGEDPVTRFSNELAAMRRHELINVNDRSISLTESGHRYRDLAVQLFFSDNVRRLVSEHDYAE